MKKFISIILILCFAMQLSVTVSAARTNYALADYTSGSLELTNFDSVTVGKNSNTQQDYQTEITVAGGRNALKLTKPESYLSGAYINYVMNASYLTTLRNKGIDVTVSYYDSGDGSFLVRYTNRVGNFKPTEIVYLENTNTWKTHTFSIYDGLGNGNIQISLYDYSMGTSSSEIILDTVRVEQNKYFPIYITEKTERVGNHFHQGEDAVLPLQLSNRAGEELSINYQYTVCNSFGETEKTGSGSLLLQEGTNDVTIPFNVTRCGAYQAKITFENQQEDIFGAYKTNFSISEKAEQNPDFGMQVHYSVYTDRDPKKSMSILKNSGASMARDTLFWYACEKEKGNIAIPQSFFNALEEAEKNNIRLLVNLNGNNSLYFDDTYTVAEENPTKMCFPMGEAAVHAYGDFVEAVVSQLKGRVDTFEIWNEFQSTASNHSQYVSYYIALLKEAYTRAKKANPDCVIVGGSGFEAYKPWVSSFFAGGGRDYLDVFSLHLYDWYLNFPNLESGLMMRMEQHVFDILDQYSWENPMIWITESGWSTAYVSDQKQYTNGIRLYVMLKSKGVDKFFWYDFKNDGTDWMDRERAFGTIYSHEEQHTVPYSAKPAYVAFSNMNQVLANTEYQDVQANTDGTKIYQFDGADQRVYVLWNIEQECETKFSCAADRLYLSDVFGNKQIIYPENGEYTVSVREEPIYLIEEKAESPLVQVKEINYQTGDITVYLSGLQQGRMKAIEVLKPGKTQENILNDPIGALCFLGQSSESNYEFTFRAETEGRYEIYTNTGEELIRLGAELYRPLAAEVTVSQDNREIKDYSDIATDQPLTISLKIDNPYHSQEWYLLAVGQYQEKRLKNTFSAEGVLSANRQTEENSLTIPAAALSDFDAIQIFVWKGQTRLIPVMQKIELK